MPVVIEQIHQNCVDWLKGIPAIKAVRPFYFEHKLRKRDKTPTRFNGVLYTHVRQPATDGEFHGLYIIGSRPANWHKDDPVFVVDVPGLSLPNNHVRRNEWYVSCYIDRVAPKYAEYHPCGANFILREWLVDTTKDPQYQAIDDQFKEARPRINLTLHYLD